MNFRATLLLLTCTAIAACSESGPEISTSDQRLRFDVSGKLEDPRIVEASGLARSIRRPGVLYVMNDGDEEILYVIDQGGSSLGTIEIGKAKNRDWEDLAAFELDGEPYLLIADIGDNDADRSKRTLYVLREPEPGDDKVKVDWKIDYEYPDGPRDAESAAVDIENERVLLLSKRDIPPVLYDVPLRPSDDGKVTARWLGTITSLEHPTRQDVAFARKTKDWHWQPTGMDISADNRAAVILTYRYVYYFLRRPDQGWYDALNSTPIRVGLGNFRNAEAVAFGDDARTVIVTGEDRHARVLRIDLGHTGDGESAAGRNAGQNLPTLADTRTGSSLHSASNGRLDNDQ